MKRHFYNGFFSKLFWFGSRFGYLQLINKPLNYMLAPIIMPFIKRRHFKFLSKELPYFIHRYNVTWMGERSIEIPIINTYLSKCSGKVLEVGNVLSHYYVVKHDIVDKYEQAQNVINVDILDFNSDHKYELIFSISTFEHIGFDDDVEPESLNKISQAILKCRNLLSSTGKLVLTLPFGYNPEVDRLIFSNDWNASGTYYYKRDGRLLWNSCSRDQAIKHPYGFKYPFANSLLVVEFDSI